MPSFKTGEWTNLETWTMDGYYLIQRCREAGAGQYECWYESFRQDPLGAPVRDDLWRDDLFFHEPEGGGPGYWDHF